MPPGPKYPVGHPGTGRQKVRTQWRPIKHKAMDHWPSLMSRKLHHHFTAFPAGFASAGWLLKLAIKTSQSPTMRYERLNLWSTPGIRKVLRSLWPPTLLMTRPRKNRMADRLATFSAIDVRAFPLLSWLCVEMTKETPMIHMNQGKTRSATVIPFHGELEKWQR